LKKKQWIIGLIAIVLFVALFVWGNKQHPFDFAEFYRQVQRADWRLIALGIGCIYFAYIFRSARWAWLMRHNQRVGAFSLIGTQVMGFTAVALIGRVADPVRPFLVSKRTGSPLGIQIAVYVVERLFDFGAMALIICAVLLAAPTGSTPHPEALRKIGIGFLTGATGLAVFMTLIRLSGDFIASLLEKAFGLISPKLGHSIGNKIRAFHKGLDTMRSLTDFVVALTASLVMWVLITVAYIATLHAFGGSPELAAMNLASCILLMAISGTASALQLPIVGWFSQIIFVEESLKRIFGVSAEAATAAAALLLVVTFLSIVPVGLIWAQMENISLRSVARESGKAGEELVVDTE
jgi:hypothetical protein